ncbi:MAG: hypothetical protein KJ755_13530 [Alphaproteobacteria bacterium]|nr:hypothetical protein [Alphaproteobacteria bacterium]
MENITLIEFKAEDFFTEERTDSYELRLTNVSDQDLRQVADEEQLFQVYQSAHELYLMQDTTSGVVGYRVATEGEATADDYDLNKYRDFEAASEALLELAERAHFRSISFNALKQYRLDLLERDVAFL